jgi:glycosyltransferase involved in cell wall biosynthesis
MTSPQNLAVSVIIPARNEEVCLALCLESLVAQAGVDFEVIVVDDASTDRTVEIAKTFASPAAVLHLRPTVSVISAPALPDGWTGKNNAMTAGAKNARGKWLLFTDADTVHKPGSLARAVAEAEHQGAALLSYSPEQEVRTFWEKAVMPVIFAELAVTYPPGKVSDPASAVAAANGQYLMISRHTYDAVGGHARVASDLLEDVAMARLVKSSGEKILFRYGGDAIKTRMYRSWEQMQEGWTKNLALLFRRPIGRALLWFLLWLFAWVTFLWGSLGIASADWRTLFFLLPVVFLYVRVAAGKFPVAANMTAIVFGVPLAAYLLLRSALLRRNGGVTWKGRKYQARSA